jgi:hypothetical protein
MGEAVKCMLLTRDAASGTPSAPLLDSAFSLQDLRASLWG